jgi:large subunit ribosomal protein L25
MATNTVLNAQMREGRGKGPARQLRMAGRVPAVLYGRDMEAVHLSVDAREADQLFHSISVDNTIVDLQVEGEKEAYRTLVREIQVHPYKATLIHVDFLRIQKGVVVDVEIPVNLVGIPVGVKMSGGVLEQVIHDLPVRCIPSKIPEVIEIDVTGLDIGDSLHISDITFGEGVEVTVAQERTICGVAVPKAEEVPEEEEEEEGVEGEVAEEDAAAEQAAAEETSGEEDEG